MAAATQVFCTSDSETVGGRQNAAEEKVDDSYVQQIVSPCKKNELLVLTIATFLFLKFKPFFRRPKQSSPPKGVNFDEPEKERSLDLL